MFQKAIVRLPGSNFYLGQTTAELGKPEYQLAVTQHNSYCVALEQCGLAVTRLEPDDRYPDSTFVEDTAVLTKHCAVITRPGAVSRLGEVDGIAGKLNDFFTELYTIRSPGTLDGGDVCEAGTHFFIGLSARTNEIGAEQLAKVLGSFGYTSEFIDIRKLGTILHLKSGIAFLGDNRLAVIDELAGFAAFRDYEKIRVPSGEEYAANCVRINDHILVAAGFPAFEQNLKALGYDTIALDMSEFQKMDGGLSCLSLRF